MKLGWYLCLSLIFACIVAGANGFVKHSIDYLPPPITAVFTAASTHAATPAMLVISSFIAPANAQSAAPTAVPSTANNANNNGQLPYVDAVEMTLVAPIILHVHVKKSTQLSPEQAPNLPRGIGRFYIRGDIIQSIRGGESLPDRIRWLVDVPLDTRGRASNLNKHQLLIFAYPTAPRYRYIATGRDENIQYDMVQLVSPDAQIPYHPASERVIRSILGERESQNVPAAITGINSAYHVVGNLPNSGETQIFLDTSSQEPISLTIVQSGDSARRWSVTYGELIDDHEQRPAPNTLAWYRLACGLPAVLPTTAMRRTANASTYQAASADYSFVKQQLGACHRTRLPPPTKTTQPRTTQR